jgi:hypothetical protein
MCLSSKASVSVGVGSGVRVIIGISVFLAVGSGFAVTFGVNSTSASVGENSGVTSEGSGEVSGVGVIIIESIGTQAADPSSSDTARPTLQVVDFNLLITISTLIIFSAGISIVNL